MHFSLYILLYFLISENLAKKIEIRCPSHCKCDMFEKLRRASCTNRNLAVIEANLPNTTQLLDLSYNQISHLDKQVFIKQELISLKLLNISHNKVSQIHMRAFDGLKDLKSLDLTYNAIQYLLNNWFLSLESLEELYLRGNSFSKFNEGPLFKSKTLKRLDLSHCKISYLGKSTLADLPNLEILDVSGNYLIHLDVATMEPLKNLTVLDAKNNTFSCDDVLQNLTEYCVQRGIRFQNPCRKSVSESEKFQRMMNLAEPEDEKNSWIYDEEERKNVSTTIVKCNDTRPDKSLLQEIVDLSPALSLIIPFVYGIAVGILIGCTIQVRSKRKKDFTENTYVSFDQGDGHLRRRSRFGRVANTEDHESLHLKEWKLSESTPVLFRKNQVNLL